MTATLLAPGVVVLLAACGGSSASDDGAGSHHGGPASQSATTTTTPATTAGATSAHAATTHASSAEGLQVFTAAGCGSCHTLAAAHATGNVGPNLDDLKPSEALVDSQVTNGGAAMPSFAGRLSQAQIAAVAKFVASAAG